MTCLCRGHHKDYDTVELEGLGRSSIMAVFLKRGCLAGHLTYIQVKNAISNAETGSEYRVLDCRICGVWVHDINNKHQGALRAGQGGADGVMQKSRFETWAFNALPGLGIPADG